MCQWCGINHLEFSLRSNYICSDKCKKEIIDLYKEYISNEKVLLPETIINKNFHTKIVFNNCKNCQKVFITPKDKAKVFCCGECSSHFRSEWAKKQSFLNQNRNKPWGWYESIYGGRVHLDSSWEYLVAKSLDENKINWIRPTEGFIWYDSKNKNHKYYPDFYLIDYDVFLDPKNKIRREHDAYKLNYIYNNYDIKLYILENTSQLNWGYISTLI
jgi:hypothetical protein